MYYEEKWINGKLCYRGSPNGEWIQFTIGQYKDRVLELESRLNKVEKLLNETQHTNRS